MCGRKDLRGTFRSWVWEVGERDLEGKGRGYDGDGGGCFEACCDDLFGRDGCRGDFGHCAWC